MEKQIFKVGDRVFDISKGWGTIKEVSIKGIYVLNVVFDNDLNNIISYTHDGYLFKGFSVPALSFTEYTLQGFSQERPIDYNDYIGKWGKFYENKAKNQYIIGILKDFEPADEYPLTPEHCDYYYKHFEPLTDEQIKILELE